MTLRVKGDLREKGTGKSGGLGVPSTLQDRVEKLHLFYEMYRRGE